MLDIIFTEYWIYLLLQQWTDSVTEIMKIIILQRVIRRHHSMMGHLNWNLKREPASGQVKCALHRWNSLCDVPDSGNWLTTWRNWKAAKEFWSGTEKESRENETKASLKQPYWFCSMPGDGWIDGYMDRWLVRTHAYVNISSVCLLAGTYIN